MPTGGLGPWERIERYRKLRDRGFDLGKIGTVTELGETWTAWPRASSGRTPAAPSRRHPRRAECRDPAPNADLRAVSPEEADEAGQERITGADVDHQPAVTLLDLRDP